MIVDSAVYRDGTRVPVDCDVADLGRDARPVRGRRLRVGRPPRARRRELAEVAAAFSLHPLAVEDAVNAHQRPKLERYDDSLFLVLKTLWYVDEEDAVETGEINLFVGQRLRRSASGTARAASCTARGSTSRRGRRCWPTARPRSSTRCATRWSTTTSTSRDSLVEDVDEVEMSVFSEERTNDSARIYVLKRELAEVRRAVLPLRDPMSRFANGIVHGIDREAAPYFRDVGDHLNRCADTVDELDGLLSTAFDAHLARISVQQNDDMRKISAGAALVVVPTLIAGIYGMNFDHMPELHWTFGYLWALLLMVGTSVGLLWFFKRSGWL